MVSYALDGRRCPVFQSQDVIINLSPTELLKQRSSNILISIVHLGCVMLAHTVDLLHIGVIFIWYSLELHQ